ncbi:MAG TPA: ChaN family lipoprotein [Rhodoferax sp.]|nr:ChaN family lipoprotein [Rhodoferax sp.]
MKSRSLATLASLVMGAALLGSCSTAKIPADGNGLTPYPLSKSLQAGDIIHLPTGTTMDFDQAIGMIAAAKVIYIGEMHTNLQAHAAQRRVIEALEQRFPGQIAIGMEMFREPQQSALDRWTRGELDELQFLKASKWYDNWGSDFGHYRGILNFAREHRQDVLALNPSKEVQQQFAQAGTGPLPPELAARVPQTDFADPFQRALLEAVFKGHSVGGRPATLSAEATAKMFDRFYRTQILWEESMASRIVDYLNSPVGAGKKMVVIAGSFHVRHGLGVPRKVLRRAAWPYVIVLPTELSIPEEHREELMMDVDTPEIPLIAGDFAWMIPFDAIKYQKAQLGVLMRLDSGTVVIDTVVPGSPAAQVGLMPGDAFVSLDNFPVTEQGDVSIVMGGKKPGEGVAVRVRRVGQEMLFKPLLAAQSAHPGQAVVEPCSGA